MSFEHVAIYPLTLVLVFIVVLLLIGVLYSHIHWIAKAALTCSSLILFAGFYVGFKDSLGWPIAERPPEKFKVVASSIVEPNPSMNDPGAIYLWAKPLDDAEPRAFKLDYTREMHEKMEAAKKQGAKGQPVYMERKPVEQQNARNDMRRGDRSTQQQKIDTLDFIPPPNTTPDK